MRVLCLPRFGRQGASSRMRFIQYLPALELAGLECVVSALFDDGMLARKYRRGGYGFAGLLAAYWRRLRALATVRQFDLVWIEKEALPWFPAWLEKWLLGTVPYVMDFDDAVFHNYDLHRMTFVRFIYGHRIDRIMSRASLVIAGNRYLAERARAAGVARVEVLPTVVDLVRYAPKAYAARTVPLRVVWIGMPSTLPYLRELSEPLSMLAQRIPFVLRVIGGGAIAVPGVQIESMQWSEDIEADLIRECDVGVMPLHDTPWEQGKCAYKLIQYMACSLPVVASPIGANRDVVVDGVTGFFASSPAEWIEKVGVLLGDPIQRQRFGEAGRARVESEYCLQRTAPRLAHLFAEAGAH